MKKIFFTIALSAATLLSAQIDLRSTRYGVTVGGNYSRVSNAHSPSGPRYTLQGGFVALIPIDNSDQFYIQPEIVYYGAGETGNDKNLRSAGSKDAVYGNQYISVPLYFKGYFSEAESEFFGMVGPRFNFLVSQKIKNVPVKTPYYSEEGVDFENIGNVNGKANSFNFGIGLGLGYSYKRQLELGIRYDIGLSNTYKGLLREAEIPGSRAGSTKKKSEQVLSVGLSYIFE